MKRIRPLAVLAGLILALGVSNYTIMKHEQVLTEGRTILLELRPVDPRSLMQGDYMRLRYAENVFPAWTTQTPLRREGTFIVSLDTNNVGTFKRRDDGSPLAGNEVRLQYKLVSTTGEFFIGAETFSFEEGQAEIYAAGVYGVLRVDPAGSSILVGLANAEYELISPPSAVEH
jgi:uncharacterized membrane-anchored protein